MGTFFWLAHFNMKHVITMRQSANSNQLHITWISWMSSPRSQKAYGHLCWLLNSTGAQSVSTLSKFLLTCVILIFVFVGTVNNWRLFSDCALLPRIAWSLLPCTKLKIDNSCVSTRLSNWTTKVDSHMGLWTEHFLWSLWWSFLLLIRLLDVSRIKIWLFTQSWGWWKQSLAYEIAFL